MPPRGDTLAISLTLLALAAPARADIDFKFGGLISSDIRYRVAGEPVDSPYPNQYQLLRNGFSRNENLIKTQLQLRIGEKVKAVADVDLYLYGYSDLHNIDSLTLRENVDPYRIEVNAAYIDIYRLLPGLDVRLGRQVVVWGTADKFNPTNNVNSLDFSDPLLFGKALANNMVRLDWNPVGDFTITGVLVPIFRPSQLPRTAPIALQDFYRPLSSQDDVVTRRIYDLGILESPKTINVYTVVPEPSLANMQWALKIAGRLLGQDVSLSWYRGRFTFPVTSAANFHVKDASVDVGVTWPRMDVLGADVGGSIAALGGVGYWIEGAVIFPQAVTYPIYADYGGTTRNEVLISNEASGFTHMVAVDDLGRYTETPPNVPRALINDTTPFFKLTIGADYSIGSHVYLNVQYVHGFFDEFGSGWAWRPSATVKDAASEDVWKQRRIGDYVVAGLDVKFLSDTLLLRLFGIIKLPSLYFENGAHFDEYRATGMLFPQIAYQVWDGTEISVGAFVFFGDRSTKFGDPAAGASELFMKAKFTY